MWVLVFYCYIKQSMVNFGFWVSVCYLDGLVFVKLFETSV